MNPAQDYSRDHWTSEYSIWKECIVEIDLAMDGAVDFDYNDAQIDAQLQRLFRHRYPPSLAYAALKVGAPTATKVEIGDGRRKREPEAQSPARYRKPMPGIVITIVATALIATFMILGKNREFESQARAEREREAAGIKAIQALNNLERYRAIPDLTSYYRGYCIWVRAYDRKYHVSSFGGGFATRSEAMLFVDKLIRLQAEYLAAAGRQSALLSRALPQAITNRNLETSVSTPSAGYVSYFRSHDSDGDGKLSWTEIASFQDDVFKEFTYQNNETVLSPTQFFESRAGDCDDFAVFSASFLEYFGYDAYLMCLRDVEDDAAHEVAAIYIGKSTYPNGFLQVSGRNLFAPKANRETSEAAPDGNYVVLDYWKVGTPITPFAEITLISTVSDTVGSSM